jgi:hypothetical protein
MSSRWHCVLRYQRQMTSPVVKDVLQKSAKVTNDSSECPLALRKESGHLICDFLRILRNKGPNSVYELKSEIRHFYPSDIASFSFVQS